jgi:uncharacterized protein
MALKLAPTLEEKPDMLVLELIALFHDMADGKLPSWPTVPDWHPAKYTDTTSLSSILDPFLSHPSTYEHLSQAQIDLILKVIPCISYSTETKMKAAGTLTEWHATCPELLIAQDADRLDAIGGVGIMRCCAFSGAMGRTLLGKDKNTAEGHFYDKLVHVKDRMKVGQTFEGAADIQTPAGRREAEKRHQAVSTLIPDLS